MKKRLHKPEMRSNKGNKNIKRPLLLMLGVVSVFALFTSSVSAADDGLYNTLNNLAGSTGGLSSGSSYSIDVDNAVNNAASALRGAVSDMTNAAASGGSSSGTRSYGGTNTGGSAINGKPVIKYYPLGHEETRTYTTGGNTGSSSQEKDEGLGEAQGSASIDYDDVNYDIHISGGKVRLETDEDSYSKDVPSDGTGKVKFKTNQEKVVVNIKEDSFTVTIGEDKKVRRTLTRVKKSNSSSTAQTTPQQTKTVTEFVKDIEPLESDPIGPVINAVSLSETYHQEYEVYEERMDDVYAIYTNISNGSITNKSVMFDVPSGVMVRLTRDGKDVGFSNKTKIEGEGTYVAYFYVAEDDIEQMPAWAQALDRAMFNFRIQYTAFGGGKLESEEIDGTSGRSELESFADLVNENPEEFDQDAVSVSGDEIPPEVPEEPLEETPADIGNRLFFTEYDNSSGYFRTVLHTGDSFYSNVPDGMVLNGSVVFTPDENIRYELYKDGEEVDYEPGEYISDPGAYIMIPVIDNLEYENFYRNNRPLFHFRILAGDTKELSLFPAPDCMTIEAVRYEFEDVTDSVMISPREAMLSEDGTWEIDLKSMAGTVTTTVVRDTQTPIVSIETQPNLAKIEYLSDDIVNAVITNGSEIVSEGELIQKVTKPGRYRITLTDDAGNVSYYDFVVQYRINGYAILAIVIVFALIGAVLIFVRRAQTKVRVR